MTTIKFTVPAALPVTTSPLLLSPSAQSGTPSRTSRTSRGKARRRNQRATSGQRGGIAGDGNESVGGDFAPALMYAQRTERLIGGKQGCERLAEVIKMVTCAYGVWTLWMPEELLGQQMVRTWKPGDILTRDIVAEMHDIGARLAPAGQIPLVIGDPLRRTLWIARRPFALVLQRGRLDTCTLETVRSAAGSGERETQAGADGPVAQLRQLCGPAGQVLLTQSEALVALAPRVAFCPPELLTLRWVLAAPRGIFIARGAQTLTSWAERLLCLSMSSMSTMSSRGAIGSAQGK